MAKVFKKVLGHLKKSPKLFFSNNVSEILDFLYQTTTYSTACLHDLFQIFFNEFILYLVGSII